MKNKYLNFLVIFFATAIVFLFVGARSAVAYSATASISASPNPVSFNTSTTINWSSTYAYTCTSGGGWTYNGALSGSVLSPTLTYSPQSYTLWCTGDNGGTISYSPAAVVNVWVPVASIHQDKSKTGSGESFTVDWQGSNGYVSDTFAGMSSCTVKYTDPNGTVVNSWGTGLNNSKTTSPTIYGTHTYENTCRASNGATSDVARITHTVTPAICVSVTAPASVTAGQPFSASLVIKNTGTAVWNTGGNPILGSWNPNDNWKWNLARVSLPATTNVGSSATFNFTPVAPITTGSATFDWRMVGDVWFGDVCSKTISVIAPVNGASCTLTGAPPVVTAGQPFSASVLCNNTGTKQWNSDATPHNLGSYDSVTGLTDNWRWGLSRVAVPSVTNPGGSATFNFTATAPATAGSYSFDWKMVEDGVQWFGTPATGTISVIPMANITSLSVSPNPVPYGNTTNITVSCTNGVSGYILMDGSWAWSDYGSYTAGSRTATTPALTSPGSHTAWATCYNSNMVPSANSWYVVPFTVNPANACYPAANPSGYGTACTGATSAPNACGQTSSGGAGSIQCNGSCSGAGGVTPAVTISGGHTYAAACTSSANACGQTQANGTWQCNGICSSTPPANPSGYGTACTSAANSCGQTQANGTIQCNGTCSSTPPAVSPANYGTACTSAANSCGQTNGGTIQCNGLCSASTPPNSSCPATTAAISASPNPVGYGNRATLTWGSTYATSCTAPSGNWSNSGTLSGSGLTNPLTANTTFTFQCTGLAGTSALQSVTVAVNAPAACTSSPNTCGQTNTGIIVGGVCNATTPANPAGYGTACTSAANACGQTNTGTKNCSNVCSVSTPANPSGYGTACTSAANSCGQTNGGTIQCNGLCSASTPPNSSCPATTAAISASPSSIAYNSRTTLWWSSTNATSCIAGGPWSNSGTVSGNGLTNYLTANTTFTLQCSGYGQSSLLQSVTVNVAGINGSCSASHYTCTAGTSTNNASNASTWTWNCAGLNNGTTALCSEAKPAPTATLSISPTSVAYNGRPTITWSSVNTTSCTAPSGNWNPQGTTFGSGLTDQLTSTQTFTFQCTGNGQTSALKSVLVTVAPPPVNGVCAIAHYSCLAGTSTANVDGASSYTWSCAGLNVGTTATCSEIKLPTASLLANGENTMTVDTGQKVTLSWSSTNADYCIFANDPTTHVATSNNVGISTAALTQNPSIFQLTCYGAGGASALSSAIVTVLQPNVLISADPMRVLTTGGNSIISWRASQVKSCIISGPGLLPTNPRTDYSETATTSQPVWITSQSVFTINCITKGSNIASSSVMVNTEVNFQEF